MTKRRMFGKRLSLVGRVVAVAAVVLALAVPASAGPFDLTIGLGGTLTVAYIGGSLTVVGDNIGLQWTDGTGANAGSGIGDVSISWAGSGPGSLAVLGESGSFVGMMLSGSITSLMSYPSVGQFGGEAYLGGAGVSNLGQGDYVHFVVDASFNWYPTGTGDGHGTGVADVYPSAVPEPATLGLMSMGLVALAVRRRRARR